NSPETPVFSKGHLLYGLDAAKDSIRETGYAILVEGYMDVIALHQAGVTNVVGTLGTAFTINHLRLLNRFCKETVLTFDSDTAGINAALRTMDIFNDSEVMAKVLLLPEGDDPDTFVGKNGKAAFLALVQSAKGIIDFAIDRIIDEVRGRVPDHGGSINSKVKGAGDCLSIIKKISNRIEKDQYIQRVSRGLGIEKEVLLSELRRGNERKKGVLPEKVKETAVERPKAEEILLSLLIRDWALRKMVGDLLRVEDFTNPQFREIAGHLLRSERDIHEIINSEECNQEIKDTMTKMAVNEMHLDSPEKTLSDCIRALQRNRLEKEFKEVEKEIAAAELGGPFERVKKLLLKKQELLRQKRVLYEN
ncbi:MAG: toprim domain-containing protein, partial [Nitrospirota bacterium]|nr:toprim domain-containing protein [Nitrospirota bacterium]